jgi:hypothetical protein
MSLLGTHSGAGLASTVLAVGLACAGGADASTLASAAPETCGHSGYSYAGYQSAVRARGIAATLSAASVPLVESGHAAAWVGVSLSHAGQARPTWLQVGLVGFGVDGIRLYVEVALPTTGPRYSEIVADVPPGRKHRVAVVELVRRPNWWHALVDGHVVSKPVLLPGSSGRLHPIATAEAWDGGTPTCNRFEYRFEHVSAIRNDSRAWRPFVRGSRFQDSGYRVVPLAGGTSFLARAAGPAQ